MSEATPQPAAISADALAKAAISPTNSSAVGKAVIGQRKSSIRWSSLCLRRASTIEGVLVRQTCWLARWQKPSRESRHQFTPA